VLSPAGIDVIAPHILKIYRARQAALAQKRPNLAVCEHFKKAFNPPEADY
jgi:hypothetical protein